MYQYNYGAPFHHQDCLFINTFIRGTCNLSTLGLISSSHDLLPSINILQRSMVNINIVFCVVLMNIKLETSKMQLCHLVEANMAMAKVPIGFIESKCMKITNQLSDW